MNTTTSASRRRPVLRVASWAFASGGVLFLGCLLFSPPLRMFAAMRFERLLGDTPCILSDSRAIALLSAFSDQVLEDGRVAYSPEAAVRRMADSLHSRGIYDAFGVPWEWRVAPDESWAAIFSRGASGAYPSFDWLLQMECARGLIVDRNGYYRIDTSEHLRRVLDSLAAETSPITCFKQSISQDAE